MESPHCGLYVMPTDVSPFVTGPDGQCHCRIWYGDLSLHDKALCGQLVPCGIPEKRWIDEHNGRISRAGLCGGASIVPCPR